MRVCPLTHKDNCPEWVILAAGDFPKGELPRSLLQSAERVVCCDSSAGELLAFGMEPWAVVGDLDSLSPYLRERFADKLHHVPEQEHNDLWKALDFVKGQGAEEVVVLGGFGRREDHSIGNIMLLASRATELRISMVAEEGEFSFISEPTCFESREGSAVSLFALNPMADIEVRGLRYSPPSNRLAALWQGVSNEATSEEFDVLTLSPTIVYRKFQDNEQR